MRRKTTRLLQEGKDSRFIIGHNFHRNTSSCPLSQNSNQTQTFQIGLPKMAQTFIVAGVRCVHGHNVYKCLLQRCFSWLFSDMTKEEFQSKTGVISDNLQGPSQSQISVIFNMTLTIAQRSKSHTQVLQIFQFINLLHEHHPSPLGNGGRCQKAM